MRPYSSSCNRSTNCRDKSLIDVAVRNHQDWGTGVFAHTPRSLVEPHLQLSQFIVVSFYCPQAAFFQEPSILRHTACLLSQFNNWQCQSLQPTAGVSSNILKRLSASFFQLHVAGNRTYSSRVKHVALRRFFIQELVKEGRITVDYVKTRDQLRDIGTNHLSEQRQCYLLKIIIEFRAWNLNVQTMKPWGFHFCSLSILAIFSGDGGVTLHKLYGFVHIISVLDISISLPTRLDDRWSWSGLW